MENKYYIGIDVGTSSVRGALFTYFGNLVTKHSLPITIRNPAPGFYEQSSQEIWEAVCICTKKVSENVDKNAICGIGFDATCSLVVLGDNFVPLSVSEFKDDEGSVFDIIMWMDHRAATEAHQINETNHSVLQYVGGHVSLEMQMPKLKWLKHNHKATWEKIQHFFDLSDFLTFKATGCLSRSLCCLVCKWNFVCNEKETGWNFGFLEEIGLEELIVDVHKIGTTFSVPGSVCGTVTDGTMELSHDTLVATGLIDAHSGALALLGVGNTQGHDSDGRLAMICGTSTCHMVLSDEAIFSNGIWGPYYNAILPHKWLNEAGQSAAGSAIDYVVLNHPRANECPKEKSIYAWIEEHSASMIQEANTGDPTTLTHELHVYPDFHGNRAPLDNPDMKAMISGLTLDTSIESLCKLYLATIQALAYGTKDIIESLNSSGHCIETIAMCGGLAKSRLFAQTHADVLGLEVLLPEMSEEVLLGSAIMGACAEEVSALERGTCAVNGSTGCGTNTSTITGTSAPVGVKVPLLAVASRMSGSAEKLKPRKENKEFHDKKYLVYKRMQSLQKEMQKFMA